MKSKKILFLLLVSISILILVTGCSEKTDVVEELQFEDKEFRNELLEYFDVRYPDSHEGTLTEDRLRQHDLSIFPIINWKGVGSLEDIKKLPYLKDVTIIGSEKLTDYSPLHNLKMLESLTLVNLQNNAFEGSDSIPSLTSLNIEYNPDIKLDFLSKFPNLSQLCAKGSKISSLEHISSLSKLEKLDLSFNKITSLNELGLMKNLKIVDLRNNPINNFRGLSKLENEKLTIIVSPDVYNEHFDEKILGSTEVDDEKNEEDVVKSNIKILNSEEIEIKDIHSNHSVIEDKGIKIYVK